MKKSSFIKKVLKSKKNTVFTTKEQVENALEIFEKIGMLPPYNPIGSEPLEGHIMYCQWNPKD